MMILVGLSGPLIMPPVTGVMLNSVSDHQAGVASGVFNTSRQLGGAMAVAATSCLLRPRSIPWPPPRRGLQPSHQWELITTMKETRNEKRI
jgi:hypothetical protein